MSVQEWLDAWIADALRLSLQPSINTNFRAIAARAYEQAERECERNQSAIGTGVAMMTKDETIYRILHAELSAKVNNETLYELAQELGATFERWHENALKERVEAESKLLAILVTYQQPEPVAKAMMELIEIRKT